MADSLPAPHRAAIRPLLDKRFTNGVVRILGSQAASLDALLRNTAVAVAVHGGDGTKSPPHTSPSTSTAASYRARRPATSSGNSSGSRLESRPGRSCGKSRRRPMNPTSPSSRSSWTRCDAPIQRDSVPARHPRCERCPVLRAPRHPDLRLPSNAPSARHHDGAHPFCRRASAGRGNQLRRAGTRRRPREVRLTSY